MSAERLPPEESLPVPVGCMWPYCTNCGRGCRADEMKEAAAFRRLFDGKSVYLMRRENVENPQTPLMGLKFGMVIDGKVIFTEVEATPTPNTPEAA